MVVAATEACGPAAPAPAVPHQPRNTPHSPPNALTQMLPTTRFLLRKRLGGAGASTATAAAAPPRGLVGLEDLPCATPAGDEVFLADLGYHAPGPYQLYIASAPQVPGWRARWDWGWGSWRVGRRAGLHSWPVPRPRPPAHTIRPCPGTDHRPGATGGAAGGPAGASAAAAAAARGGHGGKSGGQPCSTAGRGAGRAAELPGAAAGTFGWHWHRRRPAAPQQQR